MKKILIVICGLMIGVYGTNFHLSKPEPTETPSTQQIEITKQQAEPNTINIERFIKSLNTEAEIILATEYGEHTLSHSKTAQDSKLKNAFAESKIKLNTSYKTVVSIATKNLNLRHTHDILCIEYSIDDIKIKAVEITNTLPTYERKLFGEKYTNQEIIALSQIAKDNIYQQLENGEELNSQCKITLDKMLKELAIKFEINKVIINNEYSILM